MRTNAEQFGKVASVRYPHPIAGTGLSGVDNFADVRRWWHDESMKRFFCSFAMVSLISPQPVLAATALCDVIQKFELSAPAKSDNPHERRWIEFHWGFDHSPETMWSWGCRHSAQQIASQTCNWLKDNTNQEFAMMLPQGIMACYGYHFPLRASYDWSGMVGTITLHGRNGNRLILDLNYRDLPHGEVALRLAVEAQDGVYAPEEMLPIEPMPLK